MSTPLHTRLRSDVSAQEAIGRKSASVREHQCMSSVHQWCRVALQYRIIVIRCGGIVTSTPERALALSERSPCLTCLYTPYHASLYAVSHASLSIRRASACMCARA